MTDDKEIVSDVHADLLETCVDKLEVDNNAMGAMARTMLDLRGRMDKLERVVFREGLEPYGRIEKLEESAESRASYASGWRLGCDERVHALEAKLKVCEDKVHELAGQMGQATLAAGLVDKLLKVLQQDKDKGPKA